MSRHTEVFDRPLRHTAEPLADISLPPPVPPRPADRLGRDFGATTPARVFGTRGSIIWSPRLRRHAAAAGLPKVFWQTAIQVSARCSKSFHGVRSVSILGKDQPITL